MELPIKVHAGHDTTLQRQILRQVRQLIVSGRLAPGYRLPSSRELSRQLGVSRNTVTSSYNKLEELGYIETRKSDGHFVATDLPDSSMTVSKEVSTPVLTGQRPVHLLSTLSQKQGELYDYKSESTYYGFPLECTDRAAFPTKAWRRLLPTKLASAASNMSRYQYPTGLSELRRAVSSHLAATRGIKVSTDQVIMLTGIQQGLNVVAQLFVRNNTRVVVETPGYRGAWLLFKNYGATLIPIDVDHHGMVVKRLLPVAADLAYVTTSRQYPMCGILPEKRRKQLIDWASQTGAYLVEVDYDSDFMYEGSPLPAMCALDNASRTIYMSSFSKTLGPGLRLGYMIVPPELISYGKSAKSLLDYGLPWLEQAVLAEFIKSGAFANHVKFLRQIYRGRRDSLVGAMAQHIPEAELHGLECGTHVVWRLPDGVPPATKLKRLLHERQVGVNTMRHFSVSGMDQMPDGDRYVLLGFGATPNQKVRDGIAIIAETMRATM